MLQNLINAYAARVEFWDWKKLYKIKIATNTENGAAETECRYLLNNCDCHK